MLELGEGGVQSLAAVREWALEVGLPVEEEEVEGLEDDLDFDVSQLLVLALAVRELLER